jgi:alanine dehydrogenase
MKIGIPSETKDREYRVGLAPDGAAALCGAGRGSGFADDE